MNQNCSSSKDQKEWSVKILLLLKQFWIHLLAWLKTKCFYKYPKLISLYVSDQIHSKSILNHMHLVPFNNP